MGQFMLHVATEYETYRKHLKNKGNYTLSYSINNISNTHVTIRKNSKFTVPVIVSYQATDRPIHHTLE